MSLNKYLITILISTVLCFATLIYVVFNINPNQTNIIGFILFYSSLGLSLIGFFALFGFGVRKVVMKKEVDFRQVYVSFRQAIFISFILIMVLVLQSQRLFTWLNIGFLVIALTSLEFFIISRKTSNE